MALLFIFRGISILASRLQRSVALSSTESEYIAVADIVHEIIYIHNILRSLGVKIGLPVTVYIDNLGAVFCKKMLQVQ